MANQFEINQLLSVGRNKEAVELCNKTLDDLKKAKGDDHQDVAKVLNILAQVYRNQNNYEDAAHRTEDALKIEETVFGPGHLQVAETLIKLGDLYCELKKLEDADSVYHRALKIKEKMYNERHPEVSKVLLKLGTACNLNEKYNLAECYLIDSMVILGKTVRFIEDGQKSYFISTSHREHRLEFVKVKLELGKTYVHKNAFNAAEKMLNESLGLFGQLVMPRDLNIAQTKHYLAKCCTKQKRWKDAEKYFMEASLIFESKRNHLLLANVHMDLGNCFLQQGKLGEAQKCFENAVELIKKQPQESNDSKLSIALLSLGTCLKELGK